MRYAVYSQKGGVGKSTIAVNLAAIAAARGERTLLVDLDPHADATRYLLGRDGDDAKPSLADLFDDALSFRLIRADPKVYVYPSPFPNLDVIPSHADVNALVPKLEARHKIFRIREVVDSLGYQTVFFDTPPADNVLTLSALVAADRVLVPFDCDDFARRAVAPIVQRIDEVRGDHNCRLKIGGIIVNQFQCRSSFPYQALEQLASERLPVLQPYISATVRIRESHFAARPMVYYEPGHKVTSEFEALYDRVRAPRRNEAPTPELATVAR